MYKFASSIGVPPLGPGTEGWGHAEGTLLRQGWELRPGQDLEEGAAGTDGEIAGVQFME